MNTKSDNNYKFSIGQTVYTNHNSAYINGIQMVVRDRVMIHDVPKYLANSDWHNEESLSIKNPYEVIII